MSPTRAKLAGYGLRLLLVGALIGAIAFGRSYYLAHRAPTPMPAPRVLAASAGEPYFIANRGNEPKLVSTSGGTEARLVTSVDTVADLRGLRNFSATRVSVPNAGLYVWTPASTVPDDGVNFIKPTSITGAGRYVLTTPAGGAPSGASGGDVVGTFPANLNTAPAVANVAALKAIGSASRFPGHLKHLADLNVPVRWDSTVGANLAGDDIATIQPTDIATASSGRWVVLGTPTPPTVAALRTLKSGQHSRAYVLHYSATGDRGGGEFFYDATSTAADDGGTVFQPGFGTGSPLATGRWLRQYSGPLKVEWFGAQFDCKSTNVLNRTDGSNCITGATFTSADVGKAIAMANATAQLTGTVAVVSGSKAVVGTGTSFTTELADSTHLWINSVGFFNIDTITDNTHLTVTVNSPSTTSGQPIWGNTTLVSTIASIGGTCVGGATLAAAGASVHLSTANVFGTWCTDDTAAFIAADAAAPQGIAIQMPSGETMLPAGLTFANARKLVGSGMRIANNNEVGNDLWYVVNSQIKGTVLRFPGSVGIRVTGGLYIGLELWNMTLVGSGHFGTSGIDTSVAATAEFNKINNVQVANFANGLNMKNSLESYFEWLFITGCRKGITAANVLCNDLHVVGGSIQQCQIGVDTAGMSSCHFDGMLLQNNKQAILWGQGDQTFFDDCWLEGNTASWGINVSAGSLVNFGFINSRSGDSFTMPGAIATGSGVTGFTFRGCRFGGTSLNLFGLTASVIDGGTNLLDVDMTTGGLPDGVEIHGNISSGAFVSMSAPNGSPTYTYAATVTPNWKRGEIAYVVMTGNLTWAAPSNMPVGGRLTLVAQQDGVGGRTVALNAIYKGTWTPALGANAVASATFYRLDGSNLLQIASN